MKRTPEQRLLSMIGDDYSDYQRARRLLREVKRAAAERGGNAAWNTLASLVKPDLLRRVNANVRRAIMEGK